MGGIINYECTECGCEIIVTGAEDSQMRPIYCCGGEVAKISSSLRQTESKKARKKTATRTKKEAARKTWVPSKSSGR